MITIYGPSYRKKISLSLFLLLGNLVKLHRSRKDLVYINNKHIVYNVY